MEKPLDSKSLIAPCGMNCGICSAYLREKNKCFACNFDSPAKPKTRLNCKIKNCDNLAISKSEYCSCCDEYPCDKLKKLDKRYRTKCKMSMIENLDMLKEIGIERFVKSEEKRWVCVNCGGIVCVHTHVCNNCGDHNN